MQFIHKPELRWHLIEVNAGPLELERLYALSDWCEEQFTTENCRMYEVTAFNPSGFGRPQTYHFKIRVIGLDNVMLIKMACI